MEGCGRLEIEVQRIGGGSHQWKAGRGKGALIKRIGPYQTMRDLVKIWEIFKKFNHMLCFQCLTQFHPGCEGVVKVRQCQKRRSCMQGQVLLLVPSTFSLTLLWKVPRHTGECECSFHSGYFVTSPSLCAKMGKHVQPGPAFTQTWSTKRVVSFENGK